MRILHLTHKPAYPGIDGGCIAMGHTLESLLRCGFEVDVLTMSTFKHPFNASTYPQNDRLTLSSVEVDLRTKAIDALWNLRSNRSYIMARFDAPQVKKVLLEKIRTNYQVIYIESIFWLPYLPLLRSSGAKLVLRSHNIEHSIWRELAYEASFPKSAYLRLLSRRLRREEHLMWQGVDLVHSISPEDSEVIQKHTSTKVVELPMSVELKQEEPQLPEPYTCHHLGAMDWIPNQEGMRWFLEEIWPEIRRKESKAEFHLAGRRMPIEFERWKSPGVVVWGSVEDASSFRMKHGILLVPLFSGSGLRIKILEAMSEGIPIMATRKAVEGLPEIEDSGIFVSDEPREWVSKLAELWHRPVEGQEMAKKGKAHIEKHFGPSMLDARLKESLEHL